MTEYGFQYKATLRQRMRLSKRILRGESVAYHIGVVGTAIYVPGEGEVIGCEVNPSGEFSDRNGVAVGVPGSTTQITVGSWDELQAAAAVAESGDTIWLLDGNYSARGSLTIGSGVTLRFIGAEPVGIA